MQTSVHSTTSSASAWRVLVVDDHVDAADTLGMLLDLSGQTARTANDGAQALVAALAFQPDVVVLDIGLPQLNGLEVARRMRLQPGGALRVLVALTGSDQPSDRRATQAAGFDAHLVKPCDTAQLLQMLPALVARRRGPVLPG